MVFLSLPLSVLLLTLVACGGSKGRFKIEGRFINMNNVEIYVYSPDGVIDGFDTIKVQDGRFAMEMPCRDDGLLMLVFPNYSQQPVFAEPGGTVEIRGNASHLKEMEAKGTDANKLMTQFRKAVANMSPPDEAKFAAQFVKDHPESPVGIYLTRRYFVDASKPDYRQAALLAAAMSKEQKREGSLERLKQEINVRQKTAVGKKLPAFTATDVDGKRVTNADLKGAYSVVSVWATWSFESLDGQRAIVEALKRADGKLKVVSICVDAKKSDCLRSMKNNNIDWPVVCDGTLLDSKLMKQLGLSTVPEAIILKDGKITDSGLNSSRLRQRLSEIFPN